MNDTSSEVLVGKHLSGVFITKNGLKQRDVLSTLLSTFALKYTIRRVQVNQHGSKLCDIYQLLFYADEDI